MSDLRIILKYGLPGCCAELNQSSKIVGYSTMYGSESTISDRFYYFFVAFYATLILIDRGDLHWLKIKLPEVQSRKNFRSSK